MLKPPAILAALETTRLKFSTHNMHPDMLQNATRDVSNLLTSCGGVLGHLRIARSRHTDTSQESVPVNPRRAEHPQTTPVSRLVQMQRTTNEGAA